MKLGLIAMSGIRAANPDLIKAGLTLPGFIERSSVIASLPSLSLLTLAALTPPGIDIEYHEVRDLTDETLLGARFDLVAIASFSAQIRDAYRLADRLRAAGAKVVLGGLHVSVLPDEAAAHCDAVAIGEGETLWPSIVDDFRAGALRREYRADPDTPFDLGRSPTPRYDLLDPSKYNRLTVQSSRGCPHSCEFCASSILLTKRYARKPVENVIREIRAIKSVWRRPFIEFADDNSFIDRAHAKRLLEALKLERVKWFTETDVSIGDDPALLDLMRESGCRQVLIGLESPSQGGLRGLELRRDWKLRQLGSYESRIAAIQSRGITVNGCFILGLDGDSEETFDAVYDMVDRLGLYETQITVLTPFPGTPLYDRLRAEGRILREAAWEYCTLFDVNFVPRAMSPERLQQGLLDLASRLYDADFVRSRRERFMKSVVRRAERDAREFLEGQPDAAQVDQAPLPDRRGV